MGLLDTKKVLISGAGRGIGLAAAKALLEHGAHVLVTDVDEKALTENVSALCEQSDRCQTQVLDVSSQASIEITVERLQADWSSLDVLINNAAILDSNPLQKLAISRWQHVIDINLSSALRLTQALLPQLQQSASASIINTLSTQAFYGQPAAAAYASAKGGLLSLTRCMAVDLGADGIRVNAVAPGFIDTRMALLPDGQHEHQLASFQAFYIKQGRIPLRRPGVPQDCAGAFVFLASDLSQYITGQTITVDGGLSATY